MTRCRIALGVLVLLLIGCLLLGSGIREWLEPVVRELNLAREQAMADAWEQARIHRLAAWDHWQRRRNHLACLTDQKELERLEGLLEELEIAERLWDRPGYTAACTQAANLAQILQEEQLLTWWNLF